MANKVKHMEIHPHGKEGISSVHHFEQSEKGRYVEPKTHIFKTHGELMNHLHEHMSAHGGKGSCPICEVGEKAKGSKATDWNDEEGEEDE